MATQSLDNIHTAVIHCSATKEGVWVDAAEIDKWHRDRGWSMIGYHRVIRLDGSVEQGRPYTRRGAHVRGNNVNTLGYCMIGGLDAEGKSKNTFTDQQMHALMAELVNVRELCKNINKVCGHRDFSPDLNGDGLITPDEWIKDCPCFSVSHKMDEWRIWC